MIIEQAQTGHHILKTFPPIVPFFRVVLTNMELLFSHHLSFAALPSTAWAQGTVETGREVGGLLWARNTAFSFELKIEQAQQQGEDRTHHFRCCWL